MALGKITSSTETTEAAASNLPNRCFPKRVFAFTRSKSKENAHRLTSFRDRNCLAKRRLALCDDDDGPESVFNSVSVRLLSSRALSIFVDVARDNCSQINISFLRGHVSFSSSFGTRNIDGNSKQYPFNAQRTLKSINTFRSSQILLAAFLNSVRALLPHSLIRAHIL